MFKKPLLPTETHLVINLKAGVFACVLSSDTLWSGNRSKKKNCNTEVFQKIFTSCIQFFRIEVLVEALSCSLWHFVGVSHQTTPMASPCWARLPQRRSSWWVSAPRAEKSSGSLQRSSERPSRRSTRWSRYTSSVRKDVHTHTSTLCKRKQERTVLYTADCNLSRFCCRGIGEATRHPATRHTHQWRASGHTHRTRLSLRCWFCSCSIKCTTQHTLLITMHTLLKAMQKIGQLHGREEHEKAQHAEKEKEVWMMVRGLKVPLSLFVIKGRNSSRK